MSEEGRKGVIDFCLVASGGNDNTMWLWVLDRGQFVCYALRTDIGVFVFRRRG